MNRLSGFAAELIELLLILVGAGVASVIGFILEGYGLSAIVGGDIIAGVWALGMGLIALYVGIVALGYEQALPRVRALAGSSSK